MSLDLLKYEINNKEKNILKKIFDTIGTINKYYVDFFVYDGTDRVTKYLNEKLKWDGLLLDDVYENKEINLFKENVVIENLIDIFKKYKVPPNSDLLSLNLNYNDFYILKKVLKNIYKFNVITVKYNSSLELTDNKINVYNPNIKWDGTNYYGASLMSYYKLLKEYNYSIVYISESKRTIIAISNKVLNKNNSIKKVDLLNIEKKYKFTDRWEHLEDFYNRKYITYNELNNFDLNINMDIIEYLDIILNEDKIIKNILENIKDNDTNSNWEESDDLIRKMYNYMLEKIKSYFGDIDNTLKKIIDTLLINQIFIAIKKSSLFNTNVYIIGDNITEFAYSWIYFIRLYNNDTIIQTKIQKEYLQDNYSNMVLNLYIKKTDNILNVGGNVGIMSIPLSKIIPNGKLRTYEPLKSNYKLLEYNVKKNKCRNIITLEYAIGNENKEMKIGDIISDKEKYKSIYNEIENYTTKIKTIDSEKLDKLECLVINIRDYSNILEGAKETIKKFRPIILFRENVVDYRKEIKEKKFNILEFCKKLNYKKIIEINNSSYLMIPENRHKIVEDDFVKLNKVDKINLQNVSGYKLYKFIIPNL